MVVDTRGIRDAISLVIRLLLVVRITVFLHHFQNLIVHFLFRHLHSPLWFIWSMNSLICASMTAAIFSFACQALAHSTVLAMASVICQPGCQSKVALSLEQSSSRKRASCGPSTLTFFQLCPSPQH